MMTSCLLLMGSLLLKVKSCQHRMLFLWSSSNNFLLLLDATLYWKEIISNYNFTKEELCTISPILLLHMVVCFCVFPEKWYIAVYWILELASFQKWGSYVMEVRVILMNVLVRECAWRVVLKYSICGPSYPRNLVLVLFLTSMWSLDGLWHKCFLCT